MHDNQAEQCGRSSVGPGPPTRRRARVAGGRRARGSASSAAPAPAAPTERGGRAPGPGCTCTPVNRGDLRRSHITRRSCVVWLVAGETGIRQEFKGAGAAGAGQLVGVEKMCVHACAHHEEREEAARAPSSSMHSGSGESTRHCEFVRTKNKRFCSQKRKENEMNRIRCKGRAQVSEQV